MTTLPRTDTSLIGRWWWTVDRWMLMAIFALAAIGALFQLRSRRTSCQRFFLFAPAVLGEDRRSPVMPFCTSHEWLLCELLILHHCWTMYRHLQSRCARVLVHFQARMLQIDVVDLRADRSCDVRDFEVAISQNILLCLVLFLLLDP